MEKGQSCVHCGEDCGNYPVLLDKNPFCCEGCKTVYQILNTNKLGKYYEIEKMPGVKVEVEQAPRIEKYAFLDLEEIQDKLLDFNDNTISKIRLFIPTIHCASCIWLLENLNSLNPGVIQSVVDFPKKEITVTYRSSEITLRALVELLVSIHYIPEISLKKEDARKSSSANKTLLIK
ncbi:MAG TPA: heavy metal translocating P-type ATPase metal-binding domain-containing protein, partial [Prolixibacteraceae bacterium]|nr:heavy metal translocating P-type ATPase metal-binding domain-containing protein [Prolixibacteraceae bacterium]